MKRKFSIGKIAAAAGAATVLMTGSASAQTPPPAQFSADESAYCVSTFAWILQVLAPNGMPQEAVVQSNIAFMMWNYELNLAMQGAGEDAMKATADKAIQALSANMPTERETQEDAQRIVDYVTGEASACGQKLEVAYPSGSHPVVVALREQAEAAKAAQGAGELPLTE